ncbi:MAG: hypothetical protein DRO13_02850 [Thermoprotei archaeon]|nr:MAG: hypothetical protein DRO13_02850 [Thermoprotei archaeon]
MQARLLAEFSEETRQASVGIPQWNPLDFIKLSLGQDRGLYLELRNPMLIEKLRNFMQYASSQLFQEYSSCSAR